MLVRDISLPSPEENILFDEVLLCLAEEGKTGESLRFWESQQPFIVLGRIGKVEEDVKIKEVKKDKIVILRRASGGGTVVQGRGCLNYTLILSKTRKDIRDLKRSYKYILGKVVKALKKINIEVDYFPISDVVLTKDKKKISGNAQKRGRNFIMHHGTLLIDFDLDIIEKYLNIPKEAPVYRRQRPHADFLSNLGTTREQIKQNLMEIFDAKKEQNEISEEEDGLLKELLKSKDVFT